MITNAFRVKIELNTDKPRWGTVFESRAEHARGEALWFGRMLVHGFPTNEYAPCVRVLAPDGEIIWRNND